MASEAILKYLVDTNRPYSCADVTVNLRGAYTKNAVQKALDALNESGKIKCKLYGKQKVYAALQLENVEESSDTEDYDTQISNITNVLNDKTSDLKKAEANLKNLVSAPTNDMTKSQIEEVKNSIDKLEKKLNDLHNTTEVISAGEKKILLEQHEKALKEYRKRKRISSDMLDAVLEGYPKSKKSFLEEFCIETDEMVNFSLKTQ
ncbi:homologous-pairing protein 2 homolog [Maniola jurtina]|uniref:homologous-pairing protein 2 homolog n=1 Tax=Maniola jurtina TaxID=191418 RepID=UPI001E688C6D|nr:homologous-pairing protein 2 homolog [Maniola jurtina]